MIWEQGIVTAIQTAKRERNTSHFDWVVVLKYPKSFSAILFFFFKKKSEKKISKEETIFSKTTKEKKKKMDFGRHQYIVNAGLEAAVTASASTSQRCYRDDIDNGYPSFDSRRWGNSSLCGPAGCGPIGPSGSCRVPTLMYTFPRVYAPPVCVPPVFVNTNRRLIENYWYYDDCGYCGCPGLQCLGHFCDGLHGSHHPREQPKKSLSREKSLQLVKHNNWFDTELEAFEAFDRESSQADTASRMERTWIVLKKNEDGETEKHVHRYFSRGEALPLETVPAEQVQLARSIPSHLKNSPAGGRGSKIIRR
jgi:hypothetical protein